MFSANLLQPLTKTLKQLATESTESTEKDQLVINIRVYPRGKHRKSTKLSVFSVA